MDVKVIKRVSIENQEIIFLPGRIKMNVRAWYLFRGTKGQETLKDGEPADNFVLRI
jgi:hypothetical protein